MSMEDNAPFYKEELAAILYSSRDKVVSVPEHILEHIAPPVEFEPFKEEIDEYQDQLLSAMMDIVSEEIKRLSAPQREAIYNLFFLGKKVRHFAKELGIKIPSLVDRKERALSILRRRLKNHPIFMSLYKQYVDRDVPFEFIENFNKKP